MNMINKNYECWAVQLSHGLEEQLHALEPLQINSARQRLAFSNPQPTAFPSHMLNVSVPDTHIASPEC